jgi:hypothetical protein
MSYMQPLGSQLTGHALGHRPQAGLGRGEGGEPVLAAQGLALAPVNRMVPRPRGVITRAASRPARKPAKQAISQTLLNTWAVVSLIEKRTFAPMLNTTTSSGPTCGLDGVDQGDHLLPRIARRRRTRELCRRSRGSTPPSPPADPGDAVAG